MMVRFTPRPVTKTHLRALGRALRVRRIDGRHWEFDVRTVCSRAWGEVQRGSATFFGSLLNLVLARCTAMELSGATVRLNF